MTANGNRGVQLLQADARVGAVAELEALRSLGVRAVVIELPYPLLNSAYLSSIGRGDDYQQYLTYYKYQAGEIYNRGMQMVIENGPMFPGIFSAGSGYDLTKHYASLTQPQYIAARAAMAGVIAREIQPDFLQLGAEPDTEAQLTGKPGLAAVSGYASLIGAAVAQVRAPGTPPLEVGAGVGTWTANAQPYIQAFVKAGVSFIDLHIYPVNGSFLENAISYTDLALSLGVKVTICEAWLLKERDSELGASSPATDPTIFSRDAFSFWAPLDRQFLTTLVRFAHWKRVSVVSAYWSKYLFAYLDYAAEAGKSAADILTDSSIAAANAIVGNRVSATGIGYRDTIGAGTFVLSGASYRGQRVAPDSIVSVFGSHLAIESEQAATSPLPAVLGGSTASVTDSRGQQSLVPFYFSSPGQLNLVLPAALATGPAILRITSADGSVSSAAVDIARVAPGIVAADATGRGVPAAIVGRLAADGSTTFVPVFDCSGGGCVPKPIDLGGSGQVYLALFGTGLRNRSSLDHVLVNIGSLAITPIYAGPQLLYAGLDQINLFLPGSLAGQGTVALYVTVDGIPGNRLIVSFR
ncbi:MAG: hypothetical protein ABUS49_03200 [Acidobacteriota bacterium]